MTVEINPRNKTERLNTFAAAYREPNAGDPNWYVEIPGIEGCFSSGKTLEEAQENIKEALISLSLKRPLTLAEIMRMDNMEYMYQKGYQGFQFMIGTAVVQSEAYI